MKTLLLISSLLLVSVVGLSQSSVKDGAFIVVDRELHDFGSVEFGSIASCEFVITNTGTKPLNITSCKGSCGCTVPSSPKEPIAPGAKGVIGVKYDTNRVGPFTKTVTILSNAAGQPTKVLTIKGNVVAATAKS